MAAIAKVCAFGGRSPTGRSRLAGSGLCKCV